MGMPRLGDKHPHNGPTPPETEEAIWVDYLTTQNYSKTARNFRMPLGTVYGIIQRLGGDAVQDARSAMRADLAKKAIRKASRLVDAIDPNEVGSKVASIPADAARAVADLGRLIMALEPKEKKQEADQAQTINVFTGIAPPSEDSTPVLTDVTPVDKENVQ